jgi:ADP-ribose pyrophosphatase
MLTMAASVTLPISGPKVCKYPGYNDYGSDTPIAPAAEMNCEMAEDDSSFFPRISSSRKRRLSEWITIVENRVIAAPHDAGAVYHSICTADYVSILAVRSDGRIPLVRQFRPAINQITIEFPGGLRDGDEQPETCAVRELAEEVGLKVFSVQPLAVFFPDAGRVSNRMWTYFASNAVAIPGWVPEVGVEHITVALDELHNWVLDGSFNHGPHLAMLGIATVKGLLPLPRAREGA